MNRERYIKRPRTAQSLARQNMWLEAEITTRDREIVRLQTTLDLLTQKSAPTFRTIPLTRKVVRHAK